MSLHTLATEFLDTLPWTADVIRDFVITRGSLQPLVEAQNVWGYPLTPNPITRFPEILPLLTDRVLIHTALHINCNVMKEVADEWYTLNHELFLRAADAGPSRPFCGPLLAWRVYGAS